MSFKEEECLDVYWKIKNFSYCWAIIKSPEFTYSGYQGCLELDPENLICQIVCSNSNWQCFKSQISFLPCDESREESESNTILSISKDTIFGQRRSAFLPKDTLTVHCKIRSKYNEKGGKVFIRSRIGVKHKCFLWTCKNISLQHHHEKLSVENSDQYGNIQLNLKSVGGINSDEQLYIEISRTGGESCYSVLKVSVLDSDGKAVSHISDEFVFEKVNRQQFWRFPPVIRNSKLLACKNLLLPKGTLSLKCDFAITLGKVSDETAVYSYIEDITPLLKASEESAVCFKDGNLSDSITDLKKDLKTILDNGTLCDISLQIGSDSIQAHKSILSARSPVFKSMFEKDMKETINKTVVIEDIDADTIRRLLLYMYTDAISDYQWENIMNLYFAGDKYEILGLKQNCSAFLNANISFSNVCQILVLADLHQDQELLSSVHEFVSKYDSEVFASEAWRELERNNSSLAIQTLREICSKKRL